MRRNKRGDLSTDMMILVAALVILGGLTEVGRQLSDLNANICKLTTAIAERNSKTY